MKNYIYILIYLLFLSININPQKNSWVEDEVIISFQDSIIDLSTSKTVFNSSNIRDEGIIKSEQLKSYLLSNEVETLEFHPLIKEFPRLSRTIS